MASPPGLFVQFFIDKKPYGARQWHAAPRIGEEVMLGPKDEKKCYRVTAVVWGIENYENYERQQVNIEVEQDRSGN